MSERSARKGVERVRRTPPGPSTAGNRPPERRSTNRRPGKQDPPTDGLRFTA